MSYTPPHNIEAEQAVLGSCLVENEVIHLVREFITHPRDFYRNSHAVLWAGMLALVDRGESLHLLTLANYLKAQPGRAEGTTQLDEVGVETLTQLDAEVTSSAHAVSFAKIVADRAFDRRMLRCSKELERIALDGAPNRDDKLTEMNTWMERVLAGGSQNPAHLFPQVAADLAEWIANKEAEREKKMAQTGVELPDVIGMSTGFPPIDDATGGACGGEFWLVGARPAMGKTSFGLGLAQAFTAYGDVYFWSGDMPRLRIARRLVAAHKGVGVRDVVGWMPFEVADTAPWAPLIWLDDQRGMRPKTFAAKIAAHKMRNPRRKLAAIIVDYVSLMAASRDWKDVAEVSIALTDLSGHHDVPVIGLQQIKREASTGGEVKAPALSDLRESSQLEQDASVVLMLHRPHYYNPEADKTEAQVWIRKNRDGPAGDYIPLLWDPECAAFRNPVPEPVPAPGPRQGWLDKVDMEEIL